MKDILQRPLYGATALVLILLLALTGCTDAVTSPEAAQVEETSRHAKLRHAHLLKTDDGAGKVLERYAELLKETEFIVGIDPLVLDMQRVLERYENLPGVTLKRSFSRVFKGFAMHVHKSKVRAVLDFIELDPDIDWVEPDPNINIGNAKQKGNLDNRQRVPNGVKDCGGEHSSTRSGDGQGSVAVDIYILDSGVVNTDINVVETISFLGSDRKGDPHLDEVGHGTHIASNVAAIDDSDGLVGLAPGARIHNFKVLDERGQTDLSTVIAAVDLLTDRKAANPTTPMVVNISFGADVGTSQYNALDEAIASSIAQGVVYVIAAGNEGIDASNITPAHVAEAITVAAYDARSKFAKFSNYGTLIDLLAPGEGVDGLEPEELVYSKMSGTSMAAPHVTGAVALYLSQHPTAPPAAVLTALIDAADDGRIKGQVPDGTTRLALDVRSF